jgi:hypothetical protein
LSSAAAAELDERRREKESAQEDAVQRRLRLAEEEKQRKMQEFQRRAEESLRRRVEQSSSPSQVLTGVPQRLNGAMLKRSESLNCRATPAASAFLNRAGGHYLARSESVDQEPKSAVVVRRAPVIARSESVNGRVPAASGCGNGGSSSSGGSPGNQMTFGNFNRLRNCL